MSWGTRARDVPSKVKGGEERRASSSLHGKRETNTVVIATWSLMQVVEERKAGLKQGYSNGVVVRQFQRRIICSIAELTGVVLGNSTV